MLISELTFPHLMADREARLAQELERRRVAEERRAEASAPEAATPGVGTLRRPRGRAHGPAQAATC